MSTASASAHPWQGPGPFLIRWLFTPLSGIRFGTWLTLLARHGLAIPPQYWPRTLFTGAASLINSPLALYEAHRYRGCLAQVQIRSPVFVLGHHRSGTTHLWNLLATNPRFVYPSVLEAVFPHNFLTMARLLHDMATRVIPSERPQDKVRFGPNAPIEEERAICAASLLSMQMGRHFPGARDRYRRYLTMAEASLNERRHWQQTLDHFARKLLVNHNQDATLLFKSPDHTGKIGLLLELYPDARFVHIHRHPYRVFQSTRRMELRTQPLYAYQRQDPNELDEFILWRYRTMYDAFFNELPKIPSGQFTEVAYAALTRDPLGEVKRIYDTLGLPDFHAARPFLTAYLDRNTDYQTTAFPRLEQADRQRIATAWAPCFAAWGYHP